VPHHEKGPQGWLERAGYYWELERNANAGLSETVRDRESIPVSHGWQRHVANVRASGGRSSRIAVIPCELFMDGEALDVQIETMVRPNGCWI
jgi:hypothetical protein